MGRSRLGSATALCLLLGTAWPCRLMADSWHDPDFPYVAKWKQYHKGSSKIGLGTAQLIHPRWIITAYHVAKFKHQNPNAGSTEIVFQGGRTRNVVEVYKAPGVDIALAKLNRPIYAVEPVALLKQPFRSSDGVVDFTIAGRSGGLHYHRVRGESRLGGKSFRVIGDPPGKAGDSGGLWGVERYGNLPDVQFAVLHGGGVAPQIGPISNWIDRIVGPGKVNWVTKSILENGIPTDTHTWTGNGRYRTWTNQGNWSSGGNPGVSGSPVGSNHETARLRWMGAKANIHAAPRVEDNWSLGRIEILPSKDHDLTVADSKHWNAKTGAGHKTIRLNGAGGQAFHVKSDPQGSFTYTFAPGIRILVNKDLYWDVYGDETLRINGRLSGTGAIIKRGKGTLVFGNTGDTVTNNGSNALEIEAGTVVLAKKAGSSAIRGDVVVNGADAVLRLNQDEQVKNSATLAMQGGLFDLNGRSETIGTLVLGGGELRGGTLRANSGGFQVQDGTIWSELAGAGKLTKTTAGSVTLFGDNTYTGSTTVSEGMLRVNGSVTSDVTVNDGRLEGTGAIVGDVSQLGGVFSPGNSAGTITIAGDYTQGLDATLLMELGGEGPGTGFDLLAVEGRVILRGILDIELTNGFVPEAGQAFTVIEAGSVEGEFREVAGDVPGDGLHWGVLYGPASVTLMATQDVIPEPTATALLCLGACLLYRRRRMA